MTPLKYVKPILFKKKAQLLQALGSNLKNN
jgi:hypothetical protein